MNYSRNLFKYRIKKNTEIIRPVTLFAFLMIVCMPIHTITVGGVGIFMLIGIPLLVMSVPAVLNRLKSTTWDNATLLISAFFIYNILAFLWAPEHEFKSIYNYVKIIAVVLCLYCQQYSHREKNLLILGAVLVGMIVCAFILLGGDTEYYLDGRITISVMGVGQDANYLGYLFLIPVAVATQKIIHQSNWLKRLFWIAIVAVLLLCVLLTGSRGALLGVAVVVAVSVFGKFKTWTAKLLFSAGMAGVAIALYFLLLMLLPDYIAARFSFQVLLDTGGTGRWDIWMNAFRVMAEAPYKLLFGFGTGASDELIGWATHNLFIQLLLEGGFVSLGLFLSFLFMWLKRLAKRDKMCFSVALGCMVMAMTLSVNTVYYFWIVFILSLVASDVKRY